MEGGHKILLRKLQSGITIKKMLFMEISLFFQRE